MFANYFGKIKQNWGHYNYSLARFQWDWEHFWVARSTPAEWTSGIYQFLQEVNKHAPRKAFQLLQHVDLNGRPYMMLPK